MLQQARNVLMWLEDQGLQASHLIHDRDTKFTAAFDRLLDSAEVKIVKSPVMAPNANAFAESWIASLKRECLNYFACFSLKHVDHVVQAFVYYYSELRPHQGKANQALSCSSTEQSQAAAGQLEPFGRIGCQSELGGLLKHYFRRAA